VLFLAEKRQFYDISITFYSSLRVAITRSCDVTVCFLSCLLSFVCLYLRLSVRLSVCLVAVVAVLVFTNKASYIISYGK